MIYSYFFCVINPSIFRLSLVSKILEAQIKILRKTEYFRLNNSRFFYEKRRM